MSASTPERNLKRFNLELCGVINSWGRSEQEVVVSAPDSSDVTTKVKVTRFNFFCQLNNEALVHNVNFLWRLKQNILQCKIVADYCAILVRMLHVINNEECEAIQPLLLDLIKKISVADIFTIAERKTMCETMQRFIRTQLKLRSGSFDSLVSLEQEAARSPPEERLRMAEKSPYVNL